MGEKVLQEVRKIWPMVQDPAPREYIARIGKRVLATMEAQPFEYEFYVLNTPEINAFAVPGGKVFFNSGLILMVEKEDELAGVMAHEIGHVLARHIARQSEQGMKLGLATLGALLAGIFLGPQAATAIGVTAQAASATAMLKYSREYEEEADYLGLKYMERAGYDPQAMVTMLKKLRRISGPASTDPPAYLLTHPAAEQRMGNMEIQMMNLPKTENRRPPEGNLKRVQTKLVCEEKDTARAVTYFENCRKRQPDDPECLFGLGLAQRKMGALDRSIDNLSQAASLAPQDGEIYRELAAAYFLKANVAEAQKYAEQARSLSPSDAKAYFYLGRVYLEQKRVDDALQAFLTANKLDPNFGENYYHLAMAYGAKNMLGAAYRSLGYYYKLLGDGKTALAQFQRALPYYNDSPRERASIQKEVQELTPSKKELPPSKKDSK
ncbi:MAG TPA: M48 family metalloprotease [Thermodesulfobacteriota bacterium]|nr:M48 family metalloprotease [Thermodesulfobacteriota bacterium]